MTRSGFDNELKQINIELVKMGELIEKAIENAILAFKEQDFSLANKVIEKDREIDDAEKNIERKCLSLILKQQPVARDLRNVTAALKMVTDMERIGDHAADIAEIVLRIKGEHIYTIVEHIPEMANVSKKMVLDAIKAFVDKDVDAAEKVIEDDDKVDNLFEKVLIEVAGIIKKSSETDMAQINMCMDFLMIAKYFERIGDHAENICEWVQFNETGEYKNSKMF